MGNENTTRDDNASGQQQRDVMSRGDKCLEVYPRGAYGYRLTDGARTGDMDEFGLLIENQKSEDGHFSGGCITWEEAKILRDWLTSRIDANNREGAA